MSVSTSMALPQADVASSQQPGTSSRHQAQAWLKTLEQAWQGETDLPHDSNAATTSRASEKAAGPRPMAAAPAADENGEETAPGTAGIVASEASQCLAAARASDQATFVPRTVSNVPTNAFPPPAHSPFAQPVRVSRPVVHAGSADPVLPAIAVRGNAEVSSRNVLVLPDGEGFSVWVRDARADPAARAALATRLLAGFKEAGLAPRRISVNGITVYDAFPGETAPPGDGKSPPLPPRRD